MIKTKSKSQTYKSGQLFKETRTGELYMLCQTGYCRMELIAVRSEDGVGNRWAEEVKVSDPYAVDYDEINKMSDGMLISLYRKKL